MSNTCRHVWWFRYQNEQHRKKELADQMIKELEDSRKAFDEQKQAENQRLERSRQWERVRWQRESKVLQDLEMLERQTKVSKMKDFQQNLDIQCVSFQRRSIMISIHYLH